jgi:hypothetical protein
LPTLCGDIAFFFGYVTAKTTCTSRSSSVRARQVAVAEGTLAERRQRLGMIRRAGQNALLPLRGLVLAATLQRVEELRFQSCNFVLAQ